MKEHEESEDTPEVLRPSFMAFILFMVGFSGLIFVAGSKSAPTPATGIIFPSLNRSRFQRHELSRPGIF